MFPSYLVASDRRYLPQQLAGRSSASNQHHVYVGPSRRRNKRRARVVTHPASRVR